MEYEDIVHVTCAPDTIGCRENLFLYVLHIHPRNLSRNFFFFFLLPVLKSSLILFNIRRDPNLLQRNLIPRLRSIFQIIALVVQIRRSRRGDGASEPMGGSELGVVVETFKGATVAGVAAACDDEFGFSSATSGTAEFAETAGVDGVVGCVIVSGYE